MPPSPPRQRSIHDSSRVLRACSAVAATLVLACTAPRAAAQWTPTSLHPPGFAASEGYGIRATQQVGRSSGDAILWTGTPGSAVNLGPGIAVATDSVEQVGARSNVAALWSGSAGSFVNLHPPVADISVSTATGVFAGTQTGYFHRASNFGITHAGLWTGSAASWLDLSPAGSAASYAYGVHNAQQVGTAFMTGPSQWHACVWFNTAASFVDIHPAAATESRGLAVHAGWQAGHVTLIGETFTRASLWNSSAASWVNLHPPLASASIANSLSNGGQAGYTTIGGVNRASYWNGSASTWSDLHDFLPPDYSESQAFGIWTSGTGINHVVGNAVNTTLGRVEAMLWVQSTPSVTAFCFGDGQAVPCPCANHAPTWAGWGCLNSLGVGARLVATGRASISADTFTLLGSRMPNSSALYFQGTTQLFNSPFGDGLRCAGGSIVRLGTKINSGNRSSYPSGPSLPVSVQGMVTSPGMRTYQIWYRNAADFCTPSTFNLSNGLSVSWVL